MSDHGNTAHTPPPIPPDPDRIQVYNALVADEAERLAGALRDIREAQDLGELTIREAADNRIQVLETHLARLRHLRAQFLGPE